jgi:transposase-like protein
MKFKQEVWLRFLAAHGLSWRKLEMILSRPPHLNRSPMFKAEVAVRALRAGQTRAELSQQVNVDPNQIDPSSGEE